MTATSATIKDRQVKWNELLKKATSEPGVISKAYSTFWRYSSGNQLIAFFDCMMRGIPVGPIACFNKWKELGRHVKKGQKAIALCMPISRKGRKTEKDAAGNDVEIEFSYTRFIFRNNWFVLAQTDGKEYIPEPLPEWNADRALAALKIEKIPFAHLDGNTQGYAQAGRKLAINPVAQHPYKTLFHEIAHILLGHCEQGTQSDSERTPRTLCEAEAESVAMIVGESLGLPGVDESRGYIQNWYGHAEIPEKSAQKIFHVADMILKAGAGIGREN